MKQLIRLHIGLIKYLITELPKKKGIKEVVKFIFSVTKIYIKELLKIFINFFRIFDKDFRKQQKEFNKFQSVKKDLQRCLKMLNYLDVKMEKQGIPRWKRRQFWRDFHNNGQVRKEEFDALLKEIG